MEGQKRTSEDVVSGTIDTSIAGIAVQQSKHVRNRVPNMFDITNMTYEQYIERHYQLCYEEYFAKNGYPPNFPM